MSVAAAMTRYDRTTIVLHWATALLIGLLWGGAQIIDAFGQAMEPTLRSLHVTLGLTLAAVLLARIAWRVTAGRSLPADDGVMGLAARAAHYLLYILASATVALGITYAWLRGTVVWGLAFPGGHKELAHGIREFHELGANAVLLLAGAHAFAALFHHYVLRDGVLRRMLPGA
jgi:cytochrome b561